MRFWRRSPRRGSCWRYRITATIRAAHPMPMAEALRYEATGGTVEEVLALDPDVVIASTFLAPDARAAYTDLGMRVETIGIASSIADSTAQIRALAASDRQRGRGGCHDRHDRRGSGAGKDRPRRADLGRFVATGGHRSGRGIADRRADADRRLHQPQRGARLRSGGLYGAGRNAGRSAADAADCRHGAGAVPFRPARYSGDGTREPRSGAALLRRADDRAGARSAQLD